MNTISTPHFSGNSQKFESFFQEIQEKNPNDLEFAQKILTQIQEIFHNAIHMQAGRSEMLEYFELRADQLLDFYPWISENTERLLLEIINDYTRQIEQMPRFNFRAISEKIANIFQK